MCGKSTTPPHASPFCPALTPPRAQGKFEKYVALAEALVRAHVQATVAQQQQGWAGAGINKVVYDVPPVLLLYWCDPPPAPRVGRAGP